MLPHAYGWRVNALETNIPLARYVDNWGRDGDLAVIEHETGNRLGAAWLRRFKESEPVYGFVDEQTPVLSMALVPSRRGQGLGQLLIDALLDAAREAGETKVSLSVEEGSSAVDFYVRNGFEQVGVAEGGVVMTLALG